jgi:beta,beta-carotene 9',10'-dioxygenase
MLTDQLAPLPPSTRIAPATLRSSAQRLATRVPYRSPSEPRGREVVPLQGRLPDWLRGELVRVAPAIGATPAWAAAHWFDALGLAFAFELDGSAHLTLRWSLLECAMSRAADSGKVALGQFASPNQRGPIERMLQPVPSLTDNANVHVVAMGDELVSMTETPHQLVLDRATLRTRGRVHYNDQLGEQVMLAHPIIQAGTLTNLAYKFGPIASVAAYEHAAASRKRTVRASWRTTDLPYIHSFGLTPRTAIVIDHPLRVRAHRLLWSNRGVIESFHWRPETGTRLVLMDLHGGRTRSCETDALFCFHTVQAFETADATVLDLIAYPDASIIADFALDRLAQGFPQQEARLTRFSIDRQTGRVSRRTLCDVPFEFPQADYRFAAGNEARYVFGAMLKRQGAGVHSEILRVAVASGATQSFLDSRYVFGEPIFVGAPGRQREADGVLLAVGSGERGSALFVIDAESLQVLAHGEFDAPLPLGFHGGFIGGA